MGEKQKKHFGKSAYIRSVSRAIQIFRFDFPDISMQWRVEGDFPELPEIGRSRVVTNTELSFCLFVLPQQNIYTIPIYCVIRLAFEFTPWSFVEYGSYCGKWTILGVPWFPHFQSFTIFGRIETNHRATLTFNFFQEISAPVNYSPRISANFLLPAVNGLKMNSVNFSRKTPYLSFPFHFNFIPRNEIDSFPAHKSRPYLIGCLDARVSWNAASLHRCPFCLRLPVWGILHVKLLPLFFYLIVIQLGSMYKSYVSVTRQWEEFC